MAKTWVEAKVGRVGPLADTVQYLLRARGYDVVVDGTIGPMTTAAIEAFQGDNGLTVDGTFGPLTDAAVRAFQGYIRDNQAWYVDVPVVVDGIVGINTWYSFVLSLGPLPE